MNTVVKVIVFAVLVAVIIAAEKDRQERKQKRRLGRPVRDDRDWQQAFMRDVKNGYPRH